MYRLDGRINLNAVSRVLTPLLLYASQQGFKLANGWTVGPQVLHAPIVRPLVEPDNVVAARHLILCARVSSNDQVVFDMISWIALPAFLSAIPPGGTPGLTDHFLATS
jgi:hypothetical protein